MEIIIGMGVWVVVLIGTVKFAASRGRSQFVWFNLVLFFPPALFALAILPNLKRTSSKEEYTSEISDFMRRCPYCKQLVDAEKEACTVCGEVV